MKTNAIMARFFVFTYLVNDIMTYLEIITCRFVRKKPCSANGT
jgi:hypothetical protein